MENNNNTNRSNNQRSNNNNNENHRGNGKNNGKNEILPKVDLTNDNYVTLAKKVIEYLDKQKNLLTSSKIRNILSLNAEIYNTVLSERNEVLSDGVRARLQYLKVRMVYDSGKEKTVKLFIENSHLIDYLDEIKKSKEKYMLFARYLEALVAYRKLAGRDS